MNFKTSTGKSKRINNVMAYQPIVERLTEDVDTPCEITLSEWEEVRRLSGGRWRGKHHEQFMRKLMEHPYMDVVSVVAAYRREYGQAALTDQKIHDWLSKPELRQHLSRVATERDRTRGLKQGEIKALLSEATLMAMGKSERTMSVFDRSPDGDRGFYTDSVKHTSLGDAARLLDLQAKVAGLYREETAAPHVNISLNMGGNRLNIDTINDPNALEYDSD